MGQDDAASHHEMVLSTLADAQSTTSLSDELGTLHPHAQSDSLVETPSSQFFRTSAPPSHQENPTVVRTNVFAQISRRDVSSKRVSAQDSWGTLSASQEGLNVLIDTKEHLSTRGALSVPSPSQEALSVHISREDSNAEISMVSASSKASPLAPGAVCVENSGAPLSTHRVISDSSIPRPTTIFNHFEVIPTATDASSFLDTSIFGFDEHPRVLHVSVTIRFQSDLAGKDRDRRSLHSKTG